MNDFLDSRDHAAMIASRHYLNRVLLYHEILDLSDKDMMEGTHTKYRTVESSELLRGTLRLVEDIMSQGSYGKPKRGSQ